MVKKAKGRPARQAGYAALRTRRHWRPAEAAQVLADWATSGETLSSFARRHGLGVDRLRRWRERLGGPGSGGAAPGGSGLVPATIRSAPLTVLDGRSSEVPLVVNAPGFRLEVRAPQGIDPQWVAALLVAARGACA